MALPNSIVSVRIANGGVFIPRGAEGWKVFQGKNVRSGKIDTVIAVPSAGVGYDLYRWSGKNQCWCKVLETIDGLTSNMYATVQNLTPVAPVVDPNLPVIATNPGATSTPVPKKEKTMNLNKIFGRFGKAPKGEFAMSIGGGIAIKRKGGTYACLVGDALTDIENFALDIDAFFFLPTTADHLKPNDVVVTGTEGSVGFVQSVDDKGTIRVYDVNAEGFKCVRPLTHFLMKAPFITKVFSLLDAGGDGGLNPMMLLLLSGGLGGEGKDKGGMSDLLLLSALGGNLGGCCGGNANGNTPAGPLGGMSPMMLYFLMKDSKSIEGDSALPLMLMMGGGLGGAAGPLGGLFGGSNTANNTGAGTCGCGGAKANPAPDAPPANG